MQALSTETQQRTSDGILAAARSISKLSLTSLRENRTEAVTICRIDTITRIEMSPDDDRASLAANRWLKSFADHQCEASFARIVHHYSGMVFGSAKRRTGDEQLAEECTQDVFVLLARKAGSLHRHPSLTGWIYTTTKWIVQDRMKSEKRRRERLQLLAQDTRNEIDKPELHEFPLLDEALDKLKSADRNVILWHYLEGLTFSEISGRLKKSEVTCRKQASRAIGRLQLILKNGGRTVSMASLVTILSSQLCQPASASLLAAIVTRSVSAKASLTILTILQSSLYTMTLTKAQTAILIAAITLPVGFFLANSDEEQSSSKLASPPPPSPRILNTQELPDSDAKPAEMASTTQLKTPDPDPRGVTLPLDDQAIDAFMQAPKAIQGKLLAQFRRGESEGLQDQEQADQIRQLVRDRLRPQLEQLEGDPLGFADFQTAFIAEIIRTDDDAKLAAIHEIIARTYREAVAAGVDSTSRPVDEAAIDNWATRRDALDRPATREIQQLLSPFERMIFDSTFIGIMGIDLGQGDGLWNRFATDDETVVFPSEEAAP